MSALATTHEFNPDAAHTYLCDDFLRYASVNLWIRPKGEGVGEALPPELEELRQGKGALRPLVLNRAQRYLHARAEKQRRERGLVRLLGLKGRQQGFSTYVGGRFYWLGSQRFGCAIYILTHEQAATTNLWQMVERYQRHCPPDFRPFRGPKHGYAMTWPRLDTQYQVGTAGTRETGRSGTIMLFHGSEVAFWPDAASHMAAIGQTVPWAPDTEVFLESTANGQGNLFHEMWQEAVRGESDYEAVFVPWTWQPEYSREPPVDFEFTPEEREIQEAHGLTDAQLYFRHRKIGDDFRGDPTLFSQEYPLVPAEAFLAGTHKSLIKPLLVARAQAMADEPVEAYGPKVMGVDPAEEGDNDSAVARRQGRVVHPLHYMSGLNPMELSGRVAHLCDEWEREDGIRVHTIFVDKTGLGSGVVARLGEMTAVTANVIGVHNGWAPDDDERFVKKGDEMWGRILDWLEDEPCKLPLDDRLSGELTARWYGRDSSRRIRLETKEHMKDRGIDSPDGADALAETFAFPVHGDPPGGAMEAAEEFYGRRSWLTA